MFALRLLAYRLVKPFMWPVSRAVAIPRPTAFVGAGSSERLCRAIGDFGFRRVMVVTDAVLVKLGLIEPIRSVAGAQVVDGAVGFVQRALVHGRRGRCAGAQQRDEFARFVKPADV